MVCLTLCLFYNQTNVYAALDEKGEVAAGTPLTPEESAWIKQHSGPIIAGAEMDWAPFDYVQNSRATGYSNELLRLAAGKVGLPMEFVSGYTWTELLEKFKRREVDILPAVYKTPEREDSMVFTKGYITNPSVLVTHEESPGLQTLEDLAGKKVAIVEGFATAQLMAERYPNIEQAPVKNVLEGLKTVSFRKADAFIGSFGVISHHLKVNVIPYVRIVDEIGLKKPDETRLHMATVREQEILRNILQKGLDAVSETERNTLRQDWLNLDSNVPTSHPPIDFTDEEQAYIKAHPQLRFGIDVAWPPFEFLDEDEKYSGISSSVTGLVAKISGIKLEPEKGIPWNEVLEGLRSGELKMAAMIQPTPERAEYLDFTEPYVSYPSVILTQNDASFITGLSSLVGVRTGVGKGYSIEEFIRKKYPAVELVPGRDSEVVLKELSEGKTEAAVMNLAVATHIIGKLNLDNIKIATPTEFTIDLAFGVRKGETVLLNILQKSVNAISEDEMTAIKNRWVALRVNFGLDLRTILIWVIPIGFGLVFIILFVVTWGRQLSVEITERKKKEKLIALGARISQLLTKGDALRVMLQSISDILVSELSVAFARIWIVDEIENVLKLQASSGLYTHIEGDHQTLSIGGDSKISRIVSEQRPHMSNSIHESSYIKDKDWAREQGFTAFAGIPMVVEKRSVGAMVAFSRDPIDGDTVNTLLSVSDSIAVAIERNRAEEEMQQNLEELEQFSKVAIGREEKMIQLKEEINDLLVNTGKEKKYTIVE